MVKRELRPRFEVTSAAREAIATAIARHSHPVVVRIAILPSVPPTARMYLETPQPDAEVARFGEARLVFDAESGWFLEGATVDYSPRSPQGSFSIRGPRLGFGPPNPSAPNPAPRRVDLKGSPRPSNPSR